MKWITKAALAKSKPMAKSKMNTTQMKEQIKLRVSGDEVVTEFIGTGDFANAWFERQRYEVAAGRDNEPILYEALYKNEVNDPNLPRSVTIYRVNEGGIVFEEVVEGGEVKFATTSSSNDSVRIVTYKHGLEISEDLIDFNEFYRLPVAERFAGTAYNALKNHIAFSPVLTYTYPAANLTAASAVGATIEEKTLRTLEDAVIHSQADTTNRRDGPYVLLVGLDMQFRISRILQPVAQQGISQQAAELFNQIEAVIVYNGWKGKRGHKSTTYTGVGALTGYLCHVGNADEDFQSYVKQDLMDLRGNPDVSRGIAEQVIWKTQFGMYCNPLRAVEKITFPSS